MEYAYKAKGAVYQSGDYFVVVFSPLITGKAKNEHIAVKIAQDIDNLLREHNRKFRNNIINYGIGVNVGNIVNSIDEGILRFASIDKTVNITRKISDISNNEVLLSKEVHEKTISNVKAEKVGEPSAETRGLTLFRIKRIVDHEASKKFIDEFMRRQ